MTVGHCSIVRRLDTMIVLHWYLYRTTINRYSTYRDIVNHSTVVYVVRCKTVYDFQFRKNDILLVSTTLNKYDIIITSGQRNYLANVRIAVAQSPYFTVPAICSPSKYYWDLT